MGGVNASMGGVNYSIGGANYSVSGVDHNMGGVNYGQRAVLGWMYGCKTNLCRHGHHQNPASDYQSFQTS